MLDPVDRQILALLQDNARIPQAEIARTVGLAPSAVLERVRKLEARGVVRDYVTVLAGVTGWAVLATALATVFGSAPIALGVGFVWAGPFEHLFSNVWAGANQWFPGLVLESLIAGGTDDLSLTRAAMTATVYVGIAGAIALGLTTRRDVTA